MRGLFVEGVQGELPEYPVQVSNYFQGAWIPPPAQSNLYAVPVPYRSAGLDDILMTRNAVAAEQELANYPKWLQSACGDTFATTYSAFYMRKYWTCDPRDLTTEWVRERVFYPDIETVQNGYRQQPAASTHYINNVRYPSHGGYIPFANKLREGARIQFGHAVTRIDLSKRLITFTNGRQDRYDKLINTLPLPESNSFPRTTPRRVRPVSRSTSMPRAIVTFRRATLRWPRPSSASSKS